MLVITTTACSAGGDHVGGDPTRSDSNDIALTETDRSQFCGIVSNIAQKLGLGAIGCDVEDSPGRLEHAAELAEIAQRIKNFGMEVTTEKVPDNQKIAVPGATFMYGRQALPIKGRCAAVHGRLLQAQGWTWWRAGMPEGNVRNAQPVQRWIDQSTSLSGVHFDLNPITVPFRAVVHADVLDSGPDRLEMEFNGDAFTGKGHIELLQEGDTCTMTHTFDGVVSGGEAGDGDNGRAFPEVLEVKLHFLATSGRFPYQYGTGFIGLAFDVEHGL
jgi:hypothetical protein